jgi:arsenate reductase
VTPAAVGAYIGAAYFFTSSASFANPAITIGRMFSDTFAGIAPSSAPSFIAAQVIGGVLAVIVIRALYPRLTPAEAADIIVPHLRDAPASAARIAPSSGLEHAAGDAAAK